jgi:iron-sulfur cluster repair protein YtfE (RIC family)
MKRDERLFPLSWMHHDLLVYADRVRMALTTDHPSYRHSVELLLESTREFWINVFQDHMAAEKNILFACLEPIKDPFEPQIEVLNQEFAELSALYQFLSTDHSADTHQEEIRSKLIRFSDLLIHHTRFEERELFPEVQKILPEAEFNWVGNELKKALPRFCRTKPME